MARKLTDNILRGLKPRGVRYTERDSMVPGLQIRVGPKGDMTWSYEYWLAAAKKRRKMTLGPYKRGGEIKIGLAEARRRANALAAQVADGFDPQDEQKPRGAPGSFGEACDRWLKEIAVKNRSRENQGFFLGLVPVPIRDLPVEQVTRGHGLAMMDELQGARGPSTANNVLSTGSSVLGWCLDFEWIDRHPWRGIRRFRIQPRDRYLDAEEIRALWQVCQELDSDASRVVRLLLLTGQRYREILHARRDEIIDGDWLVIPESRTKNRRDHWVYLSDTTREILQGCEPGEFFFPSARRPGYPLGDVRSGVMTICRRLGNSIAHWQVKDLRTTFATQAALAGVSRLHVSMCLNHTIPGVDNPGDRVAAVTDLHYLPRDAYRDALRDAWQTWEERLLDIVARGGGKVVVMGDRHRR